MKTTAKYFKNYSLLTLFAMSLLLSSCGTYQSVYNQDGIYNDEIKRQVVEVAVINQNPNQQNYQQNSFTNRLEELENIGENEVFVDVDSYSSDTTTFVDDETNDNNLNYNANAAWGYDNTSAPIININVINDPYWNGFNNWGFIDPWLFNNWGFYNGWGGRRSFGRNWGYNRWGFNNGFAYYDYNSGLGNYLHPYLPNFGITGFRNNRYANGYVNYGRRDTNGNNTTITSRENISANGRNRSATSRRSSGIIRGNETNIIPTRRSSTISRSSSTVRRGSTSNSNNNSNTAERRSSTSNNNGNTTQRRSSTSSSSSGTSGRSSSSRSSSSTSRRGGN